VFFNNHTWKFFIISHIPTISGFVTQGREGALPLRADILDAFTPGLGVAEHNSDLNQGCE